MKLLSDEQLGWAARLSVPILGRAFARRAAARALHAPALVGAGDDAAVLALLGLYAAAAEASGRDRMARRARAVARAAIDGTWPTAASCWPLRWRRRLATVLAPRAPEDAAALLPDAPLAQAACRLAAGADVRLPEEADGPEACILRAALAPEAGRAAAINRLFACFDLVAPLPSGGDARLSCYGGEAPDPVTDGPLISVVMPLHDGADTVAMAVRSLLLQSWRTLEVLVVDDRSADESPAVVRELARSDPRIRLLTTAGPPGASAARNTAIAVARGDFVAFLDADDWAHPQRLARQMARIGGGARACVSAHYRVDPAGRPVAPRVFPMIRLCPISMVVRRDALLAAGPFELAPTGADAELLGRMDTLWGRRGVVRDPAPLTVASWRARSLSNDAGNPLAAAERTIYREAWMRRHAAMLRQGLPRPEAHS